MKKKEIILSLCAILVPGGGIVAGLYVLNKLKKRKQMTKFKLTKEEQSKGSSFIDPETTITGYYKDLPIPLVDLPFVFNGELMGNGITTSLVTKILEKSDTHVLFKTKNSIYKIEETKND